MTEIKTTNTATKVKNEKAEADLEKLRESAEKDKEKAKKATEEREEAERLAAEEAERKRLEKEKAKEEARKKAEKEKELAEQALKEKEAEVKKKAGNVALAAGGVVLNELAKKDTTQKQKKQVILLTVLIIALLALGYFLFKPQITHMLGLDAVPDISIPEDGEEEPTPEEIMGPNKIDFTNAVLGKAREESKLIVLEQEVNVESEISNALANIALFKKTKKIHTTGIGYYTVDLKGFSDENVSVDLDQKLVTVTIPHALLDHTEIDPDQTTFEETNHAIFGFGEIKLTQEQQNVLDKSIKESIEAELNDAELYDKADEIARLKVRELLQPVVSAVSEEFIVEVVQE